MKTRMIIGIGFVIVGLFGILVMLPLFSMGGYRSSYPPATYTVTTRIGSVTTSSVSSQFSIDYAESVAKHYLDSLNNPDLAVKEIMEFDYNFYIMFYEKSTGVGAFEMLMWKVNPSQVGPGMMGYGGVAIGQMVPEPGPNMMWNTKYGGMMGYLGGGMMGGQFRGTPTANMPISEDEARRIGQQYLDRYFAGATVEGMTKFYGYYTFDFEKGGKIQGMFSVNGYTGQTWNHGWHGSFIGEKEFM